MEDTLLSDSVFVIWCRTLMVAIILSVLVAT